MQDNNRHTVILGEDDIQRFFSDTDKKIKEAALRIKTKRESLDKSMRLGSRITGHRFTI